MVSARPYSLKELRALLVANSHGRNSTVGQKRQVVYLDTYLTNIGCKTIVLEPHYVDRGFLEDYAAYYVRCFESYSRTCARLHFFSEDMSSEQIGAAISAPDKDALQASYLGFLVIKPLPLTVIGRTCLLPYGTEDGRERNFPTLQRQKANFFGIDLIVRTLPFQEQDKDVAACASSALWSVLHSTARIFQHAILSPVEITKAAAAHSRLDERTLPNGSGLTTLQIADAIRSVGLEPLGVGVSSLKRSEDDDQIAETDGDGADREREGSKGAVEKERAAEKQAELKIAAMAYLRSGLSCLLLSRVSQIEGGETVVRGHHAAALTGFCLDPESELVPYGKSQTLFTASRMDRLYMHDDQIGPFAAFSFFEGNILVSKSEPDLLREGSTFAEPINMVVPLYHKIRIPLRAVVNLTVALDTWVDATKGLLKIDRKPEWDIQLNDLKAVRAAIVQSALPSATKLEFLMKPLPRFVWRVTASGQEATLFEILFDATDLMQGNLVAAIIPYDLEFCTTVGAVFEGARQATAPALASIASAFVKRGKA